MRYLAKRQQLDVVAGIVTKQGHNPNSFQKSEAGEEEEWAMGAAHDIARLCAEVTLRWRAFLHHTSDRPHVHHALAARHHALR